MAYEPATEAEKDLCTAAAMNATEVATELLRFIREGEGRNSMFDLEDLVEKLLDAAKISIEAMGKREEARAYSKIYAEVSTFLEGWA